MRRRFSTKLLVAGTLAALACISDQNPLPTQPPQLSTAPYPACSGPFATLITSDITTLYPNTPNLRQSALSQFSSVVKQCSKNPVDAQSKAVRLAGFAAKKFQGHQLVSGTTWAAVSLHIDHVYQYVSLTAPAIPADAVGPGGAVAVVAPTDPPTVVTTGDQEAGVSVPTGAFSTTQTVLVTITPDPTGANPFPNTTGFQEFGPFYNFQTFPDVPLFNQPVLVGICVDVTGLSFDQAHRLQLAHPRHPDLTALEVLARVAAGFLPCDSYVDAGAGTPNLAQAGRTSLVTRLAQRAFEALTPPPLHAATMLAGGLGGQTGSFSDFRAIDPGKLVFTVQPTNTPASTRITPAVEVTLEREDGTTIPVTSTDTVELAIGTNPSGGTLSGYLSDPLLSGVATFPNLSIDQVGAGYTLTATDTSATGAIPQAATSASFDITPLSLSFNSVSAGLSHTCGVTTTSAAFCWGFGGNGQLGNGTTTGATLPVLVSGGLTFAAVSAGFGYTCAITTSGAAYCWGLNNLGQLGNGTTADATTPVAVSGGLTFAAVSAGGNQTCGVTTGGGAYCWGNNAFGQLGIGTITSFSTTPVPVSGGLIFAAVGSGTYHVCGTTTSNAAYCWGYNVFGALGSGDTIDASTPVPVSGGLTLGGVGAGEHYACAVATSGGAYCWGYNGYGRLGNGTTTATTVPDSVQGGLTFAAVSAGFVSACGVTTSNAAYCWGFNAHGQLGNGTTTDASTPVPVSGGLTFAAVSAGGFHTCGVTTSNAAYCWGNNFDGQLGNGTTTNATTPVPVGP